LRRTYSKDRSLDKRRIMSLDDIHIFNRTKYGTPPSKENYQSRLLYFQQYGRDYKTIRVDSNGFLYEGYITYLILKEHGIRTCDVDVIQHYA